MKIAISITTHNRYETFLNTYKNIKSHLPKGAKLVVVDDGSTIPVKEANFRFEVAQGIATAKNKALELMGDADYYFCFDDDVYPKVKDWHLPYINSGLNHLCFTFDKHSDNTPTGRGFIKTVDGISYYRSPCGLMLFFRKICLDKVGGMDEAYGRWGMEHCGLSIRIFNNRLIPYPFMDVHNSLDLFHSEDYNKSAVRSVPATERASCLNKNQIKYNKELNSKAFIPFKKEPKIKHCNIVITSYFTTTVDPQRNEYWDKDINELLPLIKSCEAKKVKIIIFTDCFTSINYNSKYVEFITTKLDIRHSPNVYRWIVYNEWLQKNEFDKAWFVDSTDVELLKEPFSIITNNKLYCGDECDMLTDNRWMQQTQERFIRIFDYRQVIFCNAKETLLNCGIIGGNYNILHSLISKWSSLSSQRPLGHRICSDMAIFNYLARKFFNDKIVHGELINTKFKYFETDNKTAIWKHK